MLRIGERFMAGENKFKVVPSCIETDVKANRSRLDVTRTETLKAMNSVNPYLKFTMEVCDDFPENKLPTYFEKAMKKCINWPLQEREKEKG